MKTWLTVIMMFCSLQVLATPPNVLVWELDDKLDNSYDIIYSTLEENNFFVVFEADIQKNISRFAERWGENYNRNRLEGIRAMVFCNGWYANAVSNAEPDLLSLCPLHITLIQQQGKTRILFSRPSAIASSSNALSVAKELEADVSKALDSVATKIKSKNKSASD